MLRFLVGYVSLVCVFVLGWMVEGGVPLQVVEPTALVIALGVPFFGVLSVWSFRDWRQAWSFGFSAVPTEAEARRSVALWAFWERMSILGGFLGLLAGLVLVVSYMPNPTVSLDLETYGRAFGKAIMPLIFGVFSGVLGRILRTRVEENLSRDQAGPARKGRAQ